MRKSKTEHPVPPIVFTSITGTTELGPNQNLGFIFDLPVLTTHVQSTRRFYHFPCISPMSSSLRLCYHVPPSPHYCSNYSILIPNHSTITPHWSRRLRHSSHSCWSDIQIHTDTHTKPTISQPIEVFDSF